MALELNSKSNLTKVGIPWNRRMRPTLVRWCERTEAVRPPPTRLFNETTRSFGAVLLDVYVVVASVVHLRCGVQAPCVTRFLQGFPHITNVSCCDWCLLVSKVFTHKGN